MPAEVFIRTDNRSALDYLLAPVTSYLRRAMREPCMNRGSLRPPELSRASTGTWRAHYARHAATDVVAVGEKRNLLRSRACPGVEVLGYDLPEIDKLDPFNGSPW